MFAEFHFAQPLWLSLLILPVLLAWWWHRPVQQAEVPRRLRRYAAAHLLPFLIQPNPQPIQRWGGGRLWLAWLLLPLALAGPRWDRVETPLWQAHTHLVIVLDISASMDLRDTSVSRLAQAKAEINALLAHSQGIRAGLVAFASVAQMVTPLSEDIQNLRQQLEPLDSKLVRLPGSRAELALTRAERMFVGQSSAGSKHIWLLSDGDFAEPERLLARARALAAKGIHLHIFGVGTVQGMPLPKITDRKGAAIWSRLDEAGLQALATAGDGIYQHADGNGNAALVLRTTLARAATASVRAGSQQVWYERFYLLLAPLLLLLLPSWRRVWYGEADDA